MNTKVQYHWQITLRSNTQFHSTVFTYLSSTAQSFNKLAIIVNSPSLLFGPREVNASFVPLPIGPGPRGPVGLKLALKSDILLSCDGTLHNILSTLNIFFVEPRGRDGDDECFG